MTEQNVPYDSTADTLAHICEVQKVLGKFSGMLAVRAVIHDQSKLQSPEKEVFDEFTPKLRGLTYGSDEYSDCLARLGVALRHHYANNSHHPEHFDDGISGMNLIDLVEMFADWAAAVKRHADGDLRKSIEVNRKRFGMDTQLVRIFENTVALLQ
jgi:hypothetical protein